MEDEPKSNSDSLGAIDKLDPAFSQVSTLGERVFLLLARQWHTDIQLTNRDSAPPRSLDLISLSCLLLAVEWGRDFTNVAFEQIHANMEASEDRGNWGWLDQIPWRLCQISQLKNPSKSNEVNNLVEKLTHHNSSIRVWMLEIGWMIRSWLDASKAIPLLLKNLADTLAGPFMSAALAAAIVAGEDIEGDGQDKFYKIAEDFDFLDFQEQYLDRLNYIKEHGIIEMQSPFWMLETQCRRIISGAAFGQRVGVLPSTEISGNEQYT